MTRYVKKIILPMAAMALLIVAGIQTPDSALAQGPGEPDDQIGPVGIVVDADTAQEGDVLATGEEHELDGEKGCDFGDQVEEIEIVGTPSLPAKVEMHVAIGPTEECELIVTEVLWSASTGESGDGTAPPDNPGPGEGDDEGDGATGGTDAQFGIAGLPIQPSAAGSIEYEAWAKGWWKDGLNARITEAYVDYVYNRNGSSLSFAGYYDYYCDELSTHWRTTRCQSSQLASTSTSIGRDVKGDFRTIWPIKKLGPLMARHSITTELTARPSGIHIRCVSSNQIPDTGVWPLTVTFECDGELQRND